MIREHLSKRMLKWLHSHYHYEWQKLATWMKELPITITYRELYRPIKLVYKRCKKDFKARKVSRLIGWWASL